ncbi:RHS repeat domain-containing protein [Flavobacterium sp.]|uniref:RHS repeat domain-containing protein n=2 Tax=Flavobacterium sp. TaxID=239 RepID=UPI0040489EE1
MTLPGRTSSSTAYRYGFQGQEKDDELKGEGNSLNYKYRMHDPRVGRFFAVDPLEVKFPWNSPYAFSENRVIDGVELEGLEFDNMKIDVGFKINITFTNAVKIKTTLYTAFTNDKHGFGVNLINNGSSFITNVAYVPKISYSFTANDRLDASATIAGFNPIRPNIHNPDFGIYKYSEEDPKSGIISDMGVGAKIDFYKKTISLGLFNQELATKLATLPDKIDGSTSLASLSTNLIESNLADMTLKTDFKTIKFGTAGTKISSTKKEEILRKEEQNKADKLEEQNKTSYVKRLEGNINGESVKVPKILIQIPVINKEFELKPSYVKSAFDAIRPKEISKE